MLPELASFIEKEILRPAAARFDIEPNGLTSLDGFENYVAEGSFNHEAT